jgi:FkbM family methyltransferase
MPRLIHQFDNGLKIFDDHLTRFQRDRYQQQNLHEPEEEKIFVEIIHNLPETACFVNMGAAVGYYAMLAKKMAPGLTVHVVEPLAQHRKFFRENIKLNRFSLRDFTLHHEAIACRKGVDYFLEQDYGSVLLNESAVTKTFLQTIFEKFTPKRLATTTKKSLVHTITLNDLIKRLGRPVDLLMMDVQGFEADILHSSLDVLQAGKIKTFLIGTHGPAVRQACLFILQQHGFSISYEQPDPVGQPDGMIHATLNNA